MTKKIFIFFLSFSIIFINNASFAAENEENKCPIQRKTPDVLRNYIKNIQIIQKNINKQLYHLKMKGPDGKYYPVFDYKGMLAINPTNKKDWDKLIPFARGEYFKISDRITYFFNELFNWNGFKAETYYYGKLAIFQEIPPPIVRDFHLLKRESDKIDRSLNFLIRHGFYNGEINLDKICEGVKGVCNFPNVESIGDALTLLKANNNKITDVVILSLEGDLAKEILPVPNVSVGKNIFFVEKNFLDEIAKYYNKYTMTDCSINGDYSWFKDAWKKITKAVENGKISKDVMKEWKEAIELAKGMPNEQAKYEEIEKKLLTKELKRQGLSPRASKAILDNLKRFNEKGFYSLDNNFITNTINYGIKNIKRETDRFNVFWEGVTRFKSDVFFPDIFSNVQIKLANSAGLEKEINTIYEHAEPYILIQTEQEEKIKAQFREAYLNLKIAIFNLNEVEDMACKICESQMTNITDDFCCPKNSIIK